MTVLLLWPARLQRHGTIDSLSGIFRREIVGGGSGPDKNVLLGCAGSAGLCLIVAETFGNRGLAVLNGLCFDGLCLMVA